MKETRIHKDVSECWTKKDYGKSVTDKTHFKPNVSVWNDLQGSNTKVGVYDSDIEMGKLRANLSNKALDMAEVDEIAKKLHEHYGNEINTEKQKILEEIMSEESTKAETTEQTTE